MSTRKISNLIKRKFGLKARRASKRSGVSWGQSTISGMSKLNQGLITMEMGRS